MLLCCNLAVSQAVGYLYGRSRPSRNVVCRVLRPARPVRLRSAWGDFHLTIFLPWPQYEDKVTLLLSSGPYQNSSPATFISFTMPL